MQTERTTAPDALRVAAHIEAIPRSGIRDFFDIVASRKDVISLGIGEPDFTTPDHILSAAIRALQSGATHYTGNTGLPELRRAIGAYMQRTYDVRYDWEREILVTVGVSEAMDLCFRALIAPGDEVLYHAPCFVAYAPLIRIAHGVPVAVETRVERGFRLRGEDLEPLRTAKTRAVLINFPTNPTGSVQQRDDLESIADFARRNDLLVITDDVYSELTYEGERMTIAALPGMHARTLVLNGLSKAWAMTGFRVGFACAPPVWIEAMMKIHQYGMMCAPTLSQHAAIAALNHGDDDIHRMRESYRERRDFICDALNQMGLACPRPHGAFYAFPCIRATGLRSAEFARALLEEENVACVPGTAFGACGEGFVRCSYATAMSALREAMRRMARFVSRRR